MFTNLARKGIHSLIDQRPGGACVHTRGNLPVRAAIATIGLVFFQMPANHPVWTYHHTGPASDALVRVRDDHPVFIPVDGTADASIHAGRFFTMPADQGHLAVRFHPLDIHTAFGNRMFRYGAEQGFAFGMLGVPLFQAVFWRNEFRVNLSFRNCARVVRLDYSRVTFEIRDEQ